MNYSPVAIALGSNLGNSFQILAGALEMLDTTLGVRLEKRSSWYLSAPIGPPQPDYINGCAIASTELTPPQFLATLQHIEHQFGRIRTEHWGPRTLDLDLLLYGDLILDTPDLQIPHPRMGERAFVLVPLAEIAPDWVDPVSQLQIQELLKKVDSSGIVLSNDNSRLG
ncbi:2-amino-4-hydroxy-6-hydroxymethyldihydropteridine diphosphokinase [Merismopedia glauca]|uniref:2-amino-4-hydroxy-6-hydroxymethyldihydropteridine diphosphokinase n=1 Tax=Merismopedia glauca CCAP 1448/3 TaxID=1296344 RepID=A0A2T1C6I8_9CYAN|nr:2-amino-4-hydroxy-6-hydroxymethyldihydropteridine diphosphokinase [Merismopedia glauca]PSB03892.1 2-amino-4-hydroxy-6-hydroxymethyldihydropteridine diphosphokinase [Merismopedia glauca CCAP 1448/3]